MSVTFNADEIFEMAEEIERKGAEYYGKAADKATDKVTKKLLRDLAAMEQKHLVIFQEMRKELSEREKQSNVFDPDNEANLYLRAMADDSGWEGQISPTMHLKGDEDIVTVLQAAIKAEKDSILFYVGLKDLVPEKAGKDKIDEVIEEEVSHAAMLKKELKKLQQ